MTAHSTPVSTPSGPSAGLEGQDATQETQDATEAAQRRVERYAEGIVAEIKRYPTARQGWATMWGVTEHTIARAVIAVADAEHHQRLAEIDAVAQTEWRARAEAAEARVAEMEATVAKVRERAERAIAHNERLRASTFLPPVFVDPKDILAILDAPKDATAP